VGRGIVQHAGVGEVVVAVADGEAVFLFEVGEGHLFFEFCAVVRTFLVIFITESILISI